MRWLAALVLGLGLAWEASALDPDKALIQFPHRAWQTADGLPQNSVLNLAQTPDGYLWGGTWEGLVRFDGVRFTTYDKTNTPALPGRSVRGLTTGPDGTLWIAMTEGIAGWRQGAFFPVVPPPGTLLAEPRDLLAARDGSLWIATYGFGVSRMFQGRFQTWRAADGLGSDKVVALADDAAGAIWAGSDSGLQRWNGRSWEAPISFEGQERVSVQSLMRAPDGTLWAGTEKGDVYRLEGGSMRRVPEASIPGAPVVSILVDRAGSLWVGSLGLGVVRLAGGRRSVLDSKNSLAGDQVSDLLEDAEGNLWIGTDARGLHRLKDAPFTSYGAPEGLASEMVLTIRETRDGSIWFGMVGGGVTRLRDGKMTSWSERDGLILDRVRAIAEGPDGSVWLGTRDGLSRWQAGRFTSYGTAQGLSDTRAYLLDVDTQGTLWVGTPTGLTRWTGERFEPFTPRGGLPGQNLSALLASARGGLWVGTNGGGLARLRDGQSTVLAPEGGQLNSRIMALHEDEAGTLWAGTNDGLFRWKDGHVHRFSVAEGLFDNRIFQILPDERGHLWMSSNKGISRVAVKDLEAVADGRLPRVTARVYGAEDGMRSEECNALGSPAGWRDHNGRLWFPTIRGAVAYTPGPEATRAPPPPVTIEELRVDDRTIPRSELDHIPRGEGKVEFHYTSAGLRAPQQLHFRYQLEGVDTDWVQAGPRREAYYTRLPPGSYRFRVAAEYLDGGGAAPGAELTFYLKPRLHQTWAFRVACALLAVLLVAGGVWLRLHQARGREQELQARVDQRTAELATVNADLQVRLQELQSTREQLVHAEKMAAVGTLAAGVGHELNNPLAFIISNLHFVAGEVRDSGVQAADPPRWKEVQQALSDTLQGTERMRRIIQDLKTFSRAKPRQLKPVELHTVLDLAITMADVEIRHRARRVKDYGTPPIVLGDETQLGQVFLNLLINAAQALPQGQVDRHEIRVTTRKDERGHAVVAVSDTGQGIPPEVLPRIFEPFFTTKPVGVGTGLGLALCHSYVHDMGGEIRVRSELGRGTTFEVCLPPAPRHLLGVPSTEPGSTSSPSGPMSRLMVIDNEPLILTALSRTLAPEHEVVPFTSARQALERLRAGEHFELILCDLMMPDMTGMELYDTLVREMPRLAECLVFLTGVAFTEGARAFLDRTHLPCLEKPFEPEALRTRIRELLIQRAHPAA
ncbi:two-component regulator propeller domain-containing protein [Hyalangium gracile]|uniref:two-component regulator propeller domain-containing protein n=1 Tax=Hyalangium gracile TaxID=394092 RepID=UPI001CCA6786|nr:two-component regulator propeller domain-containing protein [Hyalangium gracile]